MRIRQASDIINMRIMMAGIEANAHFTMKMTIDKKGMWMSVTMTFCLVSSSDMVNPPYICMFLLMPGLSAIYASIRDRPSS